MPRAKVLVSFGGGRALTGVGVHQKHFILGNDLAGERYPIGAIRFGQPAAECTNTPIDLFVL